MPPVYQPSSPDIEQALKEISVALLIININQLANQSHRRRPDCYFKVHCLPDALCLLGRIIDAHEIQLVNLILNPLNPHCRAEC
ncbi:MAG: hypothetical protein PHG00_10110 [Methylococcales bacterium]|nr:hypothetical protein [Methylococcales bacterium]